MTTDKTLDPQATLWCQPISEEAYCGEPSRYDDAYEQFLQETNKLESVHGESCDWAAVAEAADLLTRTRTKDMNVLGGLAVAKLHVEGIGALPPVLQAYHWLLEHHGKEMFPNAARRRGRASTYGWMVKWLEAWLAENGITIAASDRNGLEATEAAFLALDALMRDQLEDDHPGSKSFRDRLRLVIEELPTPSADAGEAPAGATTSSAPAANTAQAFPASPGHTGPPAGTPAGAVYTGAEAVTNAAQAQAGLTAALQTLKKVGDFMVGQSKGSLLGHYVRHTASLLQDASFGERPQPIKELIREARATAKRTGLEQGCSIIQEALRGVGDNEQRFRLRLALASLCIEGGQPRLARPILKDLKEEIKTPIGEWLPSLLVDLAEVSVASVRALDGDEEYKNNHRRDLEEDEEEMMVVLSRFAPSVALRAK